MVPMKHDYSAEKKPLTVATYHWSITGPLRHADTFEFFANNKIAINIALPTARMLEKGKRANFEVLQCVPWKKRL